MIRPFRIAPQQDGSASRVRAMALFLRAPVPLLIVLLLCASHSSTSRPAADLDQAAEARQAPLAVDSSEQSSSDVEHLGFALASDHDSLKRRLQEMHQALKTEIETNLDDTIAKAEDTKMAAKEWASASR